MRRKPPSKRKPESAPIDEKHQGTTGPDLGQVDGAGHPGGAADLDAKSDHEKEHDH